MPKMDYLNSKSLRSPSTAPGAPYSDPV